MAAAIRFTCVQCGAHSKKRYSQLRGARFKDLVCRKCGYVPHEGDIRTQLSNLFSREESITTSKRRRSWAA
jgi:hypothetical protein